MRREKLVRTVEKHLEEFGFSPGSWLWQPRTAELIVVLGKSIKKIKLRTSITTKELIFEMGRLAGLAEAAGSIASVQYDALSPIRSNGKDHSASLFVGMPA